MSLPEVKSRETATTPGFRAAPITENQLLIGWGRLDAPPQYVQAELDGATVAFSPEFRATRLKDTAGRPIGVIVGRVYSGFEKDFIKTDEAVLPVEVTSADDLELRVIPQLAGVFVLLTSGALPRRIYPDHAGALSIVYDAQQKLAATCAAMLLDEDAYRARFRADLHATMVLGETNGGWIPGTITAHTGVLRLLANHYLDLEAWTTTRFWPRPGEFDGWRDYNTAVVQGAEAIRDFSHAVCRNYRTGATLTAGFDTRLVVASVKADIDRCKFFTVTAPGAEMDVDLSQEIAAHYGLNHSILRMQEASPAELAIWDRMAGDCMIEAPRRTHKTLGQITDCDVVITGLYGEIGRCRYYRQDYLEINEVAIDAHFMLDRLTVPHHPEVVENIDLWLKGIAGQPNSVILDIALGELKLGSWAMGQRPMTSSVKFAFMPFTQRAVFDGWVGVAPKEKNTKDLFWAQIRHLWPELDAFKINKYGDARDYAVLWRKMTNPVRVRRYLRDRFAKKSKPVPAG